MPGFLDEITSPKGTATSGGIMGTVTSMATAAASQAGRTLIDEVGARTGLALSNIGPEAQASLGAPRGTGTVSPDAPSARNIQQKAGPGIMGWLTANWKIAAGIAAVAVGVWYLSKRKR